LVRHLLRLYCLRSLLLLLREEALALGDDIPQRNRAFHQGDSLLEAILDKGIQSLPPLPEEVRVVQIRNCS